MYLRIDIVIALILFQTSIEDEVKIKIEDGVSTSSDLNHSSTIVAG